EPRRIGESDSDHRMKESWETLIRRADRLAAQSAGAGELLTFYAGLLRAQQDIYESLRRRKDWLPSGALADDLPVIRVMTRGLLQTVEARAPELLAVEARDLLHADGRTLDELLMEYWLAPSDVQFFAKALLQPYTRWLAETGARPTGRQLPGAENRCPFCGGRPQLSFLLATGQTADGGGRNLLCATCLTAWPFRRVLCACCGEERPARLAYFHTPEYDHVRVEACDTCRYYLKAIDLTRLGLAVPLVDEVAAAPLDLWAREHGYTKIELNLVGL